MCMASVLCHTRRFGMPGIGDLFYVDSQMAKTIAAVSLKAMVSAGTRKCPETGETKRVATSQNVSDKKVKFKD